MFPFQITKIHNENITKLPGAVILHKSSLNSDVPHHSPK